MALLVIVEGDHEPWLDCPFPHNGGGMGTIGPSTANTFVRIDGNPVIVKAQSYQGPDGCGGNAGTNAGSITRINGTNVVRAGDAGTNGCHALMGAQAVVQSFVFSD